MKARSLFKMLMNERGQLRVEERDGEEIAAEAYAEMEAEAKGIELPKKDPNPVKEGEKEGETQEEDPNARSVEIAGAPEENKEGEPKPEGEQTEEGEPTPEKEGEPDPETEKPEGEEEQPPETVDRDAQITEHAKLRDMTYAEAKEDIEKTETIVEQFKNDPKEMAKAMRSKDREYDKLKNEMDKIKVDKPPVFRKLSEEQFRHACKANIEAEPDKFLDAYKKRYPAKSESLSEEAILEEVMDLEWNGYNTYATKKEAELTTVAKKIRDDFIGNMSKEDRAFLPDVKVFLSELQDADIVGEDWDPQYLIDLAKGRRYDADIKAAKEGEYKRGKEETKILGIKTGGGKQGPSKAGKEAPSGLSSDQKEKAEHMFSLDDGYPPEKAWKMFQETFEEELKKDPKFVN